MRDTTGDTSSQPRFSPQLILALAITAVSTGALFVRLAEAPPLVIAFWRCALATFVLIALFGRECLVEWRRLTRRDGWLLAGTGFALAVHFAAWISSLSYTSVASSIVIVNTTPLWVALLSPVLTTDRVRPRTMFAIALAFVGCVVIGAGDFELSRRALMGDGLALVGAWMSTLYMLSGRKLRRTLSLAPYITACYGVAALMLFLFTSIAGESVLGYSPSTYGWLACLALVPQLIGHSSYNYALKYVSAALTSVATMGESVGATLLAWTFLREAPSLQTVVGGAIVLVGMFLAVRGERS